MSPAAGESAIRRSATAEANIEDIVERRNAHVDKRGRHFVGRAEVRDGGELALTITPKSEAGRLAAALLDDDVLDAVLWGSRPVVRLR